ncbi:hypothetical protein [Deinococcus alpinitundrae]|uniref:hypothetical protein n=1 Tax=Deinococcus alpinitundrae TaxID=468913 RepID=UPI00137956C7|nr:hypothetical protein [Deinococcus alpinitundrae]
MTIPKHKESQTSKSSDDPLHKFARSSCCPVRGLWDAEAWRLTGQAELAVISGGQLPTLEDSAGKGLIGRWAQ